MKKISFVVLFIGFIIYYISSIHAEDTSSVVVEDSLGRNLQYDEEPQKILSLAESTTEILISLGLKERLIEGQEFKDFPTIYTGNREKYNFPRNYRATPHIVFVEGKENFEFFSSKFEDLHWKVFVYHPESLQDIYISIEKISHLFGRNKVAKTVVSGIKSISNFIGQQTKNYKKSKIFIQTSINPLRSAAERGFIHDIIVLLNGDHTLSSSDAEKIVIACPKDQFQSWKSEWKKTPGIPAAQENKIYWIDFKTLLEPGSKLSEGIVRLSKILHYPQPIDQ